MIRCRTLGPLSVTVDGSPAPPELLWRKNLALFLYLARSPTRSRTRDHLIGMLWPEKDQSSARHSLREAIRVLRKVIGEDGLTTEGDQVQLGADRVELDTDRLEQAREAHDWKAAAALVAGDFLEGFGVPESSVFEDWLGTERLFWQRRSVEVLVQFAEALIAAGDVARGHDAAQQALIREPVSEPAARAAIRAAALADDPARALATYDRLCAALRESGSQPSAAMDQLVQRVRRERTWSLPAYLQSSERGGSRRLPLAGREAELAQLLALLGRAARDRTASAAIIEGDAGIGKTRLVEELLARARLEGFARLAMRAVPGDEAHVGGGITALARGGLLDAPGISGAPPAALATFAAQQPEWAERFPAATRGGTPLPVPAAFTELLRAATEEQPVVVLIDDAQWVDSPSLEAVHANLRDLASRPLLWILSVARHPARPELDQLRTRLGRDVPGAALRLEPLSEESVARLARSSFPRYTDEEVNRLARRVLHDSAGLPLLAVEILSAVALGLELEGRPAAWPRPLATLDQTLPGDLPDALVAAIRIGFRRLSKNAQDVLTAAAILGPRVPRDHLARATGLSSQELNATTDELEWQRWLQSEGRGFSFVTRIIRDVIDRDMVTAGQRQRIREEVLLTPS